MFCFQGASSTVHYFYNIIPPAGGRKYKLGVLGAIGEPFVNAYGNQRFVFVLFSFLFVFMMCAQTQFVFCPWPDRNRNSS